MRRYIIIGLTGPTGSGKSTVSAFFREQGFEVINADELARSVVSQGSVCLKQLALVFGSDIIDGNGRLDRRLLAKRAFSSKENTALLNEITHPHIFLRSLKACREYIDSGKKKIVFDAPVLFESNSDLMCDAVVSVIAPKATRITRIAQRDGIDVKSIEERIHAQHDDDYYINKSDYVIDGSEPLEQVRANVLSIIERIDGGI